MNVVELVIDQCAEKKHIFLLMQSVRKKKKKKEKKCVVTNCSIMATTDRKKLKVLQIIRPISDRLSYTVLLQ